MYPGVDGTATPKPMMPCKSKAAAAGTFIPKARKHTAKAAALVSQSANDQTTTPANRTGLLSTSSPATIPSAQCVTRAAALAGSNRLVIRSSSASHGAGRWTTMRASTNTAPNSTAALVATVDSDRPPTSACRGNDGAPIANAMSASIMSPSKTRSTPIDASDVVKRTGSWRVATYARATSPARAGSKLFAMKPIAVACQSGSQANRRPSTSRRISRHRMVRSGNVAVASMTAARSSNGSAWRASSQTCRRLMRWRTQASNATLTMSPMSQAPRQRRVLLGFDGEDNEIADFVDDRAESLPARALRRVAQLLRSVLRTRALIEESANVDGFVAAAVTPAAADQLLERCGTHPACDQLLISHPRARDIGRGLRTNWRYRNRRGPARAIGRCRRWRWWRRGNRRWWSAGHQRFNRYGPLLTAEASDRDRYGRQGRGGARLVTGSRCGEHFAGVAELGGEERCFIHRDTPRYRFPRGLREFRHAR